MSTLTIKMSHQATNLKFSEASMIISLSDGREISIPLEWFPKLRDANKEELLDWRFIGEGEGIHWNKIDEDLLVANLLK